MSTELMTIEARAVPGRIDCDLGAVEAMVARIKAEAGDVSEIDVSDEVNVRYLKAARASINKVANGLGAERRRVFDAYMAPLKGFESHCKALEADLKALSGAMGARLADAEEERVARRMDALQAFYVETYPALAAVVPLRALWDREWALKRCGEVKAQQELCDKCDALGADWETLRASVPGGYRAVAERVLFDSLSLRFALDAARSAEEADARIAALADQTGLCDAAEPRPEPEAEEAPEKPQSAPESAARPPTDSMEYMCSWSVIIKGATPSQMRELGRLLARMGLHGICTPIKHDDKEAS